MTRLTSWAAAAFILLARAAGANPPPSFDVIVNTANATSEISTGDLRDVLLGNRREWPNNRRITVVERDRGPVVAEVVKSILGMSVGEYSRQLLQMDFRGDGTIPLKAMASDEAVCEFVSNAPGAIGFVPQAALELPPCRSKIRVLAIKHRIGKGSP